MAKSMVTVEREKLEVFLSRCRVMAERLRHSWVIGEKPIDAAHGVALELDSMARDLGDILFED